MLCVAYETLARRGELMGLKVRDIDFHPDGTGQALIRRGKTDLDGQGRAAYLSRETVRWLKVWLAHAQITEGAVFRRLIGKNQIGGAALNPGTNQSLNSPIGQALGETHACRCYTGKRYLREEGRWRERRRIGVSCDCLRAWRAWDLEVFTRVAIEVILRLSILGRAASVGGTRR
jgi:integrase